MIMTYICHIWLRYHLVSLRIWLWLYYDYDLSRDTLMIFSLCLYVRVYVYDYICKLSMMKDVNDVWYHSLLCGNELVRSKNCNIFDQIIHAETSPQFADRNNKDGHYNERCGQPYHQEWWEGNLVGVNVNCNCYHITIHADVSASFFWAIVISCG